MPAPRRAISLRCRARGRRIAALSALSIAVAACERVPAALEVGPVRYSEEELGALTTTQRERLALLTSLGLAIAERRADELTRWSLERERDEQLLQRLTLEEAAAISGLDERALRAAYHQEPEFELTVRHLVVLAERWRDDSVRTEARARARAGLDRVRAGESFAAVAGEVSEEPDAKREGGLLRPGRRGSWVPEFWEAARSLEVGGISEIVETRYGYHVIQLIRRDTVPFDSVRHEALDRITEVVAALPEARRRLALEKESTLLRRAVERGIEADSAALERVRSETRARVAHLAGLFGFVEGAHEEEVKAAAMRALADPRQSVRIALAELTELRAVLAAMYEVRSVAGRAR